MEAKITKLIVNPMSLPLDLFEVFELLLNCGLDKDYLFCLGATFGTDYLAMVNYLKADYIESCRRDEAITGKPSKYHDESNIAIFDKSIEGLTEQKRLDDEQKERFENFSIKFSAQKADEAKEALIA